MSLQLTTVQSTNDQVIDLTSAGILSSDHGGFRRSGLPAPFAGEGITISLEHLDVALAVTAENDGLDDSSASFKLSARPLGHACGGAEAYTRPLLPRSPAARTPGRA